MNAEFCSFSSVSYSKPSHLQYSYTLIVFSLCNNIYSFTWMLNFVPSGCKLFLNHLTHSIVTHWLYFQSGNISTLPLGYLNFVHSACKLFWIISHALLITHWLYFHSLIYILFHMDFQINVPSESKLNFEPSYSQDSYTLIVF